MLEWFEVFVAFAELMLNEGDPSMVEDKEVDVGWRDDNEVCVTAACSPKVNHCAVCPYPAVLVVYTVCRVEIAVQPKPEN